VIAHAAVTYSGVGFWYYVERSSGKLSNLKFAFGGFEISFSQACLMGVLFFISAFFCTKALSKRGSLIFIRERLFRLGLPLLIYMFIISPFIFFVLLGKHTEKTFGQYYSDFLLNFKWMRATGPLWFVETLLIFSAIYATVRKIISKRIAIHTFKPKSIILAILFTAVIAFLIRLAMPIGSVFFNLQLTYFTSYIVLFIAGIIVGENNLLEHITEPKNTIWLKLVLMVGIPFWAVVMLTGGAINGEMYVYGGFYWQSFAYALWEAFTAIGITIGLIACFKQYVNMENKYSKLISDNSFGIYVFHAPIMVAISLSIKYWEINILIKFVIVSLITYIASFLFTIMIKKVKPFGTIFK
jgi:surface polysaccharide O-acyltransferase-like enzyme